ncbi:hypothetical protein GQX74_004950 [Glossina fuscipes]|nr:hypothetical protein GQX74_004950 [Glossina fuscipes]
MCDFALERHNHGPQEIIELRAKLLQHSEHVDANIARVRNEMSAGQLATQHELSDMKVTLAANYDYDDTKLHFLSPIRALLIFSNKINVTLVTTQQPKLAIRLELANIRGNTNPQNFADGEKELSLPSSRVDLPIN